MLARAGDAAGWVRGLARALHANDRRVQLALVPAEQPAGKGSPHTLYLRLREQDGAVLGRLALQHPDADTRRALAARLRPLLPALVRHLAFERVRARAGLADLLVDLSHVLLYEDDLQVMLGGVVAYLRERFSLCLATLILRERDGSWLLRAAAGNSHNFVLVPGTPWPGTIGLTGKALRLQRLLYVPDVREEPEYVQGNALTRAELLIPIKHGGAVLGLLNLESPSADSFAAAVREVLDVLADQIGGVLHLRLLQQQLADAHRQSRAMAQELARLNTRLARSNRALDKLSRTDALTGAENRRGFNLALRAAWQTARRARQPLGLLLIDIDHFKAYNDRYGHPAGDACLSRVGAVTARTLRDDDNVFARYGGEEFAVLLPGVEARCALAIAGRVCKAIAAAGIDHAGSPLRKVTASIGAASVVPDASVSARRLVEQADRALYRAKQEGRDRACLADGDAPPARPGTPAQANGSRRTMVSSRSAPVATRAKGHSASSSTARK